MAEKEVPIACMLSNPFVRTAAMKLANKLKLNKNSDTVELTTFTLTAFFLGLEPGEFPDEGKIQAELYKRGFVSGVIEKVIEHCKRYRSSDRRNLDSYIQSYDHWIRRRLINQYLSEYAKDFEINKFLDKIVGLEQIQTSPIEVISMGELNASEVYAQEIGQGVLPSSIDLIKQGTPQQGYLKGQVTQVAAPTGAGKTTFLFNEAIHFSTHGFKTYYLAIGDMMKSDFIVKGSAALHPEATLEKAAISHKYYTDEIKNILNNIYISVLPSKYITSKDLANFIISDVDKHHNLDAIMIDYDANLDATEKELYQIGEEVYSALAYMARPAPGNYKAVFVASQVKPQYWRNEIIPKEGSAESSRKQAIIDLMITVSRPYPDARFHFGIAYLAKGRRCKEGSMMYYEVNEKGLFTALSNEIYRAYKAQSNWS